MHCIVELEVDICDNTRMVNGTATIYTGYPPTAEMHIGPSQILTICQVHYLGVASGTDKDHYRADTRMIRADPDVLDIDSIEKVQDMITTQTPWIKWTFRPLTQDEE